MTSNVKQNYSLKTTNIMKLKVYLDIISCTLEWYF